MTSLHNLQQLAVQFRNDRDWKQFHNFKDMLLSLGLEVAELGEHFQWRTDREVAESDPMPIGEELADILYWLFLFAEDLRIDLTLAFEEKMKKNEEKYPVEKARGRKEKYSELSATRPELREKKFD